MCGGVFWFRYCPAPVLGEALRKSLHDLLNPVVARFYI